MLDLGARFGQLVVVLLALQRIGLVSQQQGSRLGVGPIGAQRLYHGIQQATQLTHKELLVGAFGT